MKMTEEGFVLIKHFEGFRANAYRDAVGVWTIGYGHTAMAGAPDVKSGMTISASEGERILTRDVDVFARGVQQLVRVAISDTQFSSLVSFAYNVGLGNFRKSSVLAAVNRQDFQAVVRRLQLWNKAGGRVLPGLVRRRAAEAALFSSDARIVKPVTIPVERSEAKPALQSKTVWGAAITMVLAIAQAWLSVSQKIASIILLLAMAAFLALIIFERLKKMKEEAL
jgi:lysozyme